MTAPMKYSVGGFAYAAPALNQNTINQAKNSQLTLKNSVDNNDMLFGLGQFAKKGTGSQVDQSNGIIFKQAQAEQNALEDEANQAYTTGLSQVVGASAGLAGCAASLYQIGKAGNAENEAADLANKTPNKVEATLGSDPEATKAVGAIAGDGTRTEGPLDDMNQSQSADENAAVSGSGKRNASGSNGKIDPNEDNLNEPETESADAIRKRRIVQSETYTNLGRSVDSFAQGIGQTIGAHYKQDESVQKSVANQLSAITQLGNNLASQFATQVQGDDASGKGSQDTLVAIANATTRV